jgi:hypothetical protein
MTPLVYEKHIDMEPNQDFINSFNYNKVGVVKIVDTDTHITNTDFGYWGGIRYGIHEKSDGLIIQNMYVELAEFLFQFPEYGNNEDIILKNIFSRDCKLFTACANQDCQLNNTYNKFEIEDVETFITNQMPGTPLYSESNLVYLDEEQYKSKVKTPTENDSAFYYIPRSNSLVIKHNNIVVNGSSYRYTNFLYSQALKNKIDDLSYFPNSLSRHINTFWLMDDSITEINDFHFNGYTIDGLSHLEVFYRDNSNGSATLTNSSIKYNMQVLLDIRSKNIKFDNVEIISTDQMANNPVVIINYGGPSSTASGGIAEISGLTWKNIFTNTNLIYDIMVSRSNFKIDDVNCGTVTIMGNPPNTNFNNISSCNIESLNITGAGVKCAITGCSLNSILSSSSTSAGPNSLELYNCKLTYSDTITNSGDNIFYLRNTTATVINLQINQGNYGIDEIIEKFRLSTNGRAYFFNPFTINEDIDFTYFSDYVNFSSRSAALYLGKLYYYELEYKLRSLQGQKKIKLYNTVSVITNQPISNMFYHFNHFNSSNKSCINYLLYNAKDADEIEVENKIVMGFRPEQNSFWSNKELLINMESNPSDNEAIWKYSTNQNRVMKEHMDFVDTFTLSTNQDANMEKYNLGPINIYKSNKCIRFGALDITKLYEMGSSDPKYWHVTPYVTTNNNTSYYDYYLYYPNQYLPNQTDDITVSTYNEVNDFWLDKNTNDPNQTFLPTEWNGYLNEYFNIHADNVMNELLPVVFFNNGEKQCFNIANQTIELTTNTLNDKVIISYENDNIQFTNELKEWDPPKPNNKLFFEVSATNQPLLIGNNMMAYSYTDIYNKTELSQYFNIEVKPHIKNEIIIDNNNIKIDIKVVFENNVNIN